MMLKSKVYGNIIKRYWLFYAAVGFFYGIYSYLFDLLFCYIDYGSNCHYRYPVGFMFYAFTLLIYHFFFTFPIAIFYNSFLNYYFKDINKYRYFVGFFIGLMIGYSVHESGFSLYIGEYRALKNVIVFALTGLAVEILRTIVVKKRYENNDEYIEAV